MSADTRESTDLDALEALDFPIRCSLRLQRVIMAFGRDHATSGVTDPCDRAAVVELRCRGCATVGFVCVDHRTEMLAQPIVVCSRCHASGPALLVYDFVPIAGL